jgi:hypothetical protein
LLTLDVVEQPEAETLGLSLADAKGGRCLINSGESRASMRRPACFAVSLGMTARRSNGRSLDRRNTN